MIGKISFLLLLSLTQSIALANFIQRYSRNIMMDEPERHAFVSVLLDAPVYSASHVDFRDLRLIDEHGVETPYWLRKKASSKLVISRLPIRSEKANVQISAPEGFEITIALKPTTINADGLTIVTDQKDFEYIFQVLGSNDGEHWQVLVEQAQIYDYSRFMTFGKRDIKLPPNQYRHFKIIVDRAIKEQTSAFTELRRTLQGAYELERNETIDIHREPLHIKRIDFWHNKSETHADIEQRFDYPISNYTITHNKKKKTTLIDFEANLLPLKAIKLAVSTPNFSREAEVQVPVKQGIESRMQTIARGKLEALRFKSLKHERLTINFPEQRRQHYRIVLFDQDNPPLEINSVTGIGPGYQLLFIPQKGQHFRLQYGAEKAAKPIYDTAPIQALWRRGYHSSPAELGPVAPITVKDEGFNFIELLNSNLFLGLMLGGMVWVLSWCLYRVYQRMKESDLSNNE